MTDYIETTITRDGSLGYRVECECGYADPILWGHRKNAQAAAAHHRDDAGHRPFTPADVADDHQETA